MVELARLFGEISAFTQFNREIADIKTLMNRTDLHARIVHGSDYPLPAFNMIIHTKKMLKHGFITKAERLALNELYKYNPLIFDFVLKRTMRVPESGNQFLPVVFTDILDRLKSQ